MILFLISDKRTPTTPPAIPGVNTQLMVRGTSQEVAEWQKRWNNIDGKGVYLNTGDTGRTASPGDKSFILSFANELLNNPTIDTWKTPTKYVVTNPDGTKSTLTIPLGGPIPKGATSPLGNGFRVMQAAFVWLMEKDSNPTNAAKYLAAAKTALADQINNGADMRDSVWVNGVIQDINPGFEMCMMFDRFFEAYDIIKGELTLGERTAYDAYFHAAAHFWTREGDIQLDPKLTDRWGGNFNVLVDKVPSGWFTHKNGYSIPKFSLHWNNRRNQFYHLGLKVGLHLKRTNATGYNTIEADSIYHGLSKANYLIESAKLFMKNWLMFQVFSDGVICEYERNRDIEEKGTHYAGILVTTIADMLDNLYRSGENMYNWTTTLGVTTSSSSTASTTPKTFKLAFDWYIKRIYSGKYPLLYDYYNPSDVIDGVSSIDFYAHDVAAGAIMDRYYKDDDIKRQVLRIAPQTTTQRGSYPLRSKINSSGWNPWQSGAGGYTPARCFMFVDKDMNTTTLRDINVFNVTR